MATDSFTNSDGTVLSTHNAAWTLANGYTDTATINSNTVRNTTGFRNVAYYYSGSGSDNCQIVKKGNSGLSGVRHSACVRMTGSRVGYSVRLETSAGSHTTFTVQKQGVSIGGGNLTSSIADTSDYTLRIQATANGGNQEIRVWVNGVQQSFTYASGTGITRIDSNNALQDDGTGSAVFSTGDPGFWNTSSAAQADTAWDDFDDLVAGGGGQAKRTHHYNLNVWG